MNIRQELKQLKTDPRNLRQFGLLVGGVFAVLGGWFWMRHRSFYPYFLAPGAALMMLGLVAPRVLKPVYIAWMTLAIVLGFIVSHVLLISLYYLVITPIGLLARLWGKDFLALKRDSAATTYWIRHEPRAKTAADYERQF